uniref:Major facilitator superfamily (MFS) profile domain-containing protein n=1 Tax=Bombyx mori TaxID=7091 RepID=A0A8R2HQ36_BOMMO|nr:putative transporter SVOPL isoform X2 [Bombyx mori]
MEVQLEEALDLVGHSRHNVLILIVSSTVHLAAVLDLLGFCVLVPAASCDLKLDLMEIGYLSALPWGYYADTQGRRKAIIVSTIVGSALAIVTSFSSSFEMMLILKLIGCSFSTASITLTITYLGECTGSRHRNKYIFIMNSFNLASDFTCYALAYGILRLEFNIAIPWLSTTYRPWRLLALVMALMLALRSLMTIDHVALRVKPTFWSSVVAQTIPIFKPPLVLKTLQLFFLMSVCLSTNNVFFMWFPTMVNSFYSSMSDTQSGFCEKIISNLTNEISEDVICDDTVANNTIYSGMAFSVFFTLVNFLTSRLAKWRKIVLLSTLTISGISAVLVDIIHQPVVSMMLFIFIQLSGILTGNVASYFVDLYPTSYRGLGTSLGLMCARMTCLAGVNIVGGTIVSHCSMTFFGWAVFVLCGIAVAWFLPSDKKRIELINGV